MKEVAAHIRGEIKLPTREYEVPGPVDVKAIRSKPGIPEKTAPSRAVCLRVMSHL